MMLRILTALLIFAFLPFTPSVSLAQDNQLEHEELVKISYIYNFAKFIQWPEESRSKLANEPFLICSVGKGSLFSGLSRLSAEAKIKNRVIRVLSNPSDENRKDCHILFVDSSEAQSLESILSKVGKLPILIVGDTPGYGKSGVAINLVNVSGKIKFEINRKSILRAGLTVSSQLLELGKIIGEGE